MHKTKNETGFKILTIKQIFQRLPMAFAQVKADNNSKSLSNEMKQIVYCFYRTKEMTKKVYHNITNLIKV